MEYKGYHAKTVFDPSAGFFHGEVANTIDVITFQGKNAHELEQAFRESVDDYLSFCQQLNQPPEKPFPKALDQ